MLKKLLKLSLILSILTLVVKVLFFLKELIIANYFGTSKIVDDYNLALILPNIILNTVAPSIGVILISKVIARNDVDKIHEEKYIYIGKKEINLLIILLLIDIIYNLFFYRTLSVEYSELQVIILCLMLPILYFFQVCLVYIFQSIGKFIIGSLSSIIQVIFSIIILILFNDNGLLVLLYSLVIGLGIQILVLAFSIKKEKVRVKYEEKVNDLNFQELIPTMFSVGIMEILFSITKVNAGFIGMEGKVSAINYAYKIFNLPLSLLLTTIVAVLFPEMSKLEKLKEVAKLKAMSSSIIKTLILLMLPIAILLFQNYLEIIKFLLFRGSFDISSLKLTSEFFKAIILSLPLVSVVTILIRIKLIEKSYKFLMFTCGFTVLGISLLQYVSIYSESRIFDFSIIIMLLVLTVFLLHGSGINIGFGYLLKIAILNICFYIMLIFIEHFILLNNFYVNLTIDSIVCIAIIVVSRKLLD